MSFYDNSPGMVPLGTEHDQPTEPKTTMITREPTEPAKRVYENSEHALADGEGDPSPPAGPSPAELSADALLGPIPENIRELREGRLHDAYLTFKPIFARNTSQDADPFADPAQIEAIDRETASMFMDLELSPSEAEQTYALMRTEPTDEQRAEWRKESEAYLRTLPNPKQALDDARRLIARDRRVAALLDALGHGDHPNLLKIAIAKAADMRARGKL